MIRCFGLLKVSSRMDQTHGIDLVVDPMTDQNCLIVAAAVETVTPHVGMIWDDACCS